MSVTPHNGERPVSLETPGRYSSLWTIRQTVNELCARCGLPEIKTAQLEMAVDEACTNIIEHSYGGEKNDGTNPGIRINLTPAADRIVVEITDRGTGFDFYNQEEVHPSDYINEGRLRGLGLYIIRCFVDSAEYQRNAAAGNCLRLTKLL